MRRHWYRSMLLLVLAFVVLPAYAQEDPLRDQAAPEFDLPALSGGRISLDELRGKIVVLHFGTGW